MGNAISENRNLLLEEYDYTEFRELCKEQKEDFSPELFDDNVNAGK